MYTEKTVHERILSYSESMPDAPALISDSETVSYGLMKKRACNLASYFKRCGLEKGDSIVYSLRPSPDFVYAFLAAGICGAIAAGVPVRMNPEAAFLMVSELSPKFLICEKEAKDSFSEFSKKGIQVISVEDGIFEDNSGEEKQKTATLSGSIGLEDPLLVLFTSGTTKKPKAAILSNKNILTSAFFQNEYIMCEKTGSPFSRWLNYFPMNHVSGAIESCIAPMCAGGLIRFFKSFDPDYALSQTEKDHLTVLPGVPAMWKALVRAAASGKYDLSSLQYAVSGAATLSSELAKTILKISPKLVNPLGMTETCGFCSYFDRAASAEELSETVGKVMPGIKYRIIDSDEKDVEKGQVGIICYKGDSVISRYLSQELPKTADGFFITGDLVKETKDGSIILFGRSDDMFTSGGYNVYPMEIEDVLLEYPGVSGAVVIPIPHHTMGHVCKAYICPAPGATIDKDDLIAFAEKELMYYSVPRNIEFIEKIPVNALGKPERKKLIKLFEESASKP